MPTLRLVSAGGSVIEVVNDADVGRDPSCPVVVNDSSVSRRHARLEERPSGWWVLDQGSANGTYLDSQRIAESRVVTGQELRFGAAAYRVEVEGEDIDATVVGAAPMAPGEMATVQSMGAVPPPPSRSAPTPPPAMPPPPAPARPFAPPSAAAAAERFRPAPAAGFAHAAPPSPVPQMAPGAPPAKKKGGPWLWVGAGCCGCLLLAILGFAAIIGIPMAMTQAPANAVKQQLQVVKSGQIEQAYSQMAEAYRAQTSLQEFEFVVAQHAALRDFQDASFTSRSIENNKATISGVLKSTMGETEGATFVLIKESGGWHIMEMTVGE
jgi:predicted component of type VI protein secretion system